MKTTISFFLGLLCLLITTFLIIEVVNSINNANQLYTDITTTVVYDFKLTFLFTALFLSLLSIVFIGHAVYFFKIFYSNYCNILKRKRDTDIKKHLIDNRYEKLYNDLNNTNIYEEKQKIINNFFNPTTTNTVREKINKWLDKLMTEPVRPSEAYTKEEIIDLRKQSKIVPERDTFDTESIN